MEHLQFNRMFKALLIGVVMVICFAGISFAFGMNPGNSDLSEKVETYLSLARTDRDLETDCHDFTNNDLNFLGGGLMLVELKFFKAGDRRNHILLEWESVSEGDTVGYRIWRRERRAEDGSAEGEKRQVITTLIPSKNEEDGGAYYFYRDMNVEDGIIYDYQLEEIDSSGENTFHELPGNGIAIQPTREKGGSDNPLQNVVDGT